MAEVIEQLCIKSWSLTAKNGDHFEVIQGRNYTTTVPSDDKDTVTVFTQFWVPTPKECFVPLEGDGLLRIRALGDES